MYISTSFNAFIGNTYWKWVLWWKSEPWIDYSKIYKDENLESCIRDYISYDQKWNKISWGELKGKCFLSWNIKEIFFIPEKAQLPGVFIENKTITTLTKEEKEKESYYILERNCISCPNQVINHDWTILLNWEMFPNYTTDFSNWETSNSGNPFDI